ncbi:MAG: hypothetical protein J5758_03260 [Abditibacteriota bacterium]|nr:hypothetical protein [Abditibacteriota bacterium]
MKTAACLLVLAALCAAVCASGYPRIASFWGCPPSTTDYGLWSRYGLLICYESPYGDFVRLSRGVRALRPDAVILDTAILTSFGRPDEWYPWMKDEWWLKDSKGNRVTVWAGQVYIPNLTDPDCLEALLLHVDGVLGARDSRYGQMLREGVIQGLMHDSVVSHISAYTKDIDADGDGRPDDPEALDRQWLEAQNTYFRRLAEKYPGVLILANDADENHRPFVNGRLWESGRCMDMVSTYHWWSLPDAVNNLKDCDRGCRKPSISVNLSSCAMGYDGWRVGLDGATVATEGERERARRDFARMRAGLFATLMTDAWFSYDFGTVNYGDPRYWYAEYEAPLGEPLGDAETVYLRKPRRVCRWQAGDEESPFADCGDICRMTPEGLLIDRNGGDGWATAFATDPRRLYFAPGKTYLIELEIGTLRRGVFQIALRSPEGGWKESDRGTQSFLGREGETFTCRIFCTPGPWKDYSLQGFLQTGGRFLLKSLTVTETGPCYMYRDFEGGRVYASGSPKPLTVRLPKPMRLIDDKETPKYVIETDETEGTAKGTWLTAEGPFVSCYGEGYQWSADPEAEFEWKLRIPEAGVYTLYACLAGDYLHKGWKKRPESAIPFSKKALYSIGGKGFAADQSAADGGWVEIGTLALKKGPCSVRLSGASLKERIEADAIRLESARRLNDGSAVRSITLLPEDGVILLNPQEE